MKPFAFLFCIAFFCCTPTHLFAQHHSTLVAELDDATKSIYIKQTLTFRNNTGDVLQSILLNDWNNAYSSKTTPLAKRFSDEFVRSFHLAKDHERGSTQNLTILDSNDLFVSWTRPPGDPDLILVNLREPLQPGHQIALQMTYVSKIPSDKFTRYGYGGNGIYNLKNWFLSPARYENHAFVNNNNNNIDDIANAPSDYDLVFKTKLTASLYSDLTAINMTVESGMATHLFTGKNRFDFNLHIGPPGQFHTFTTDGVEVINGLQNKKVTDIQRAIVVDRIVRYVNQSIGQYPHPKITVSQTDYDRNPFYGLNQLPAFISPFPDEFVYEIQFLRTYLNNYLKTSIGLDQRKDNWIFDGIQVYMMMRYIDENYPDSKMMGSLSTWKLLKSFNLVNLDFNEQYSYFYMLMARKNLDQPIGASKNNLIKFNEQIAGKYRAGLSFRYLDSYLGDEIIIRSIREFYSLNRVKQTRRSDFETILKTKTDQDIDWFFDTIIDSRKIIDYKFTDVSSSADSIDFTVKNRTGTTVPIPVYGLAKGEIIFERWLENVETDSTFTIRRNGADKLVLNYENKVPEYNLRNNWSSLNGVLGNRPIKFNFMKDLEDPYYNQILYVPTLVYNLYDGFSPGLRLHNKTILDKPFIFDINPTYSSNKRMLIGNFGVAVNQNYRDGDLYNVRYAVSGSYFHYAPDAAYTKLTPSVQFRIREQDFRDNRKQLIMLREVIVHRDPTAFTLDKNANTQNYAVFNARYFNTRSEVINHVNFISDLQLSSKFGKAAAEIEYRRLFEDNRQLSLRMYAGTFLYNKTNSDFFNFALDRPTDYLFDYNYYGRSEDTGFFSQQLVLSEGGFKSKLDTQFANQWITTINSGYSIWNWIEVYGDAGLVKNEHTPARFLFDSGIRLNLVTDYLELYFPVYSSNGWEIDSDNYQQKIRFIVAFDPKTLINLFTRKWL